MYFQFLPKGEIEVQENVLKHDNIEVNPADVEANDDSL